MNRWTLACGVWLSITTALPAQPAAPRVDAATLQGSVPVELVFLRDHGPLLVRIHVLHGGQPLQVRWQEYIERWFDFLDGKKRGELDDDALAGAPNAASMRNLAAQGIFLPNRGQSLSMRDFGKTSSDTITKAEFTEYYKKNGVGVVQTGFAPPEATGPANAALFKLLDADGDGKLSRPEVEAARQLSAKLDTDDDELIALREVAPATTPTVGRGGAVVRTLRNTGQALQGTSFFHITSENARTGLATLMLARYDKNKRLTVTQKEIGLDDESFRRLDENHNGSLDLIELAKAPRNLPAVELVVNLTANGRAPSVALAKTGTLTPQSFQMNAGTLSIALGDADIGVQNLDAGRGRLVVANQFAFIVQQLKAADTKMRGYVELKDLQNPQQQLLRTLFPILDRDEDGKVTEKEAQAYMDLQAAGRGVSASFFVMEQGRNWFQALDANGDGQLSPRELMNAWQRLSVHDKNGDGFIDSSELPMRFNVVFNPPGGQQFVVVGGGGMGPTAPRRGDIYPAHAPMWFRKMDRNGDGDVSRREFLGTREDFDRLDANHDGLIDAAEAAAAKR